VPLYKGLLCVADEQRLQKDAVDEVTVGCDGQEGGGEKETQTQKLFMVATSRCSGPSDAAAETGTFGSTQRDWRSMIDGTPVPAAELHVHASSSIVAVTCTISGAGKFKDHFFR